MLSTNELLQGAGLAALIVYQFVGISILCDEHLCPVLERLCTEFRLPTALAGATLLAFGSSAPEIIIGACGAASNQTELSIPTILVSALIAFGAIPPLVVAAVGSITLDVAGVFRDAVAYGLSVGLLLYFDERSEIGAYRAGILTVAYFVYLIFVWWTSPNKHDEAERARENLVAVLEEGRKAGHSNEHHISNGSSSSSRVRASTWLAALAEQDITESLAEPFLKTTLAKDELPGHRKGAERRPPAFSPVNEGESPSTSTCCPSGDTGKSEQGSKFFPAMNGHDVGKCYEVESTVTMRATESLTSAIVGDFREGAVVRILELNGRRAKVAIGRAEGWISLTRASGEQLVGQTEVREAVSQEMVSERNDEDESDDEEAPPTLLKRVLELLSRPFELLFELLMPSNPSFAFAVCLVLLALLSEGALFCAGVLADVWHISGAISGMTLLAFGGQIPDAIAAVELARSGMPDAAVAQAVASQVINITLGVGLPFFVYTCVTGQPTRNSHPKEIFTIAASLGLVILGYVVVLLSGKSSGGKVTINEWRAGALMAAFGVCYLYSIVAVQLGW
mmetsp:Transcript_19562/g.58936  ORF Transcript_19562/g.58936 Transcript_19562/m.58936 type:complete len:566 (+) Transcript_19562:41-1738(+)